MYIYMDQLTTARILKKTGEKWEKIKKNSLQQRARCVLTTFLSKKIKKTGEN